MEHMPIQPHRITEGQFEDLHLISKHLNTHLDDGEGQALDWVTPIRKDKLDDGAVVTHKYGIQARPHILLDGSVAHSYVVAQENTVEDYDFPQELRGRIEEAVIRNPEASVKYVQVMRAIIDLDRTTQVSTDMFYRVGDVDIPLHGDEDDEFAQLTENLLSPAMKQKKQQKATNMIGSTIIHLGLMSGTYRKRMSQERDAA